MFKPGRDDDMAFRFGHNPGVGAMLYLAIAIWPIGELSRSLSLVESARTRVAGLAQVHPRPAGRIAEGLIRDAGLRWPDQDSALDRALDQLAA